MVEEFHLRNRSVSFTRAHIQEKEGQLKRDYNMIKAARMQSGSKWNEQGKMVEGPPTMWDNLLVTFPKIKKFRNNKATFPLFDDLGELYDGHLAKENYNFTSLQPQREELLQEIHDVGDGAHAEEEIHDVQDDTYAIEEEERTGEKDSLQEVQAASDEKREKKTTAARKKPVKEERPRKRIETMMGRYLEIREKQAEDEAAEMARERESREKEAAKGDEYSIKRCISIVNTMELAKAEKAKAIAVFTKSRDNREVFICTCEADQECTLIWLRNQMA